MKDLNKPKVMNFFDQAYGTNVIKRAKERPQSCRSGYSRKSSILHKLKAFKAPDPYRNSGGEFIRSQKKKEQKEREDRFNENISVTSKQVTEDRRKRAHSTNKVYNHGTATNALKREIERRKQLEYELNSNKFEQKIESYSQMQGENPIIDAHENQPEDGQGYVKQEILENIEVDSKISRKTFILDLQKAIAEEREKRISLEKQIEELKKLNSEISSQLGLKINSN